MAAFIEKHVYVLRYFLNFWTCVFLIAFILDFYTVGMYSDYLSPIAAIYMGVLTIYVVTKEFERWEHDRLNRRTGESFVVVWTVLIFSVMFLNLLFRHGYHIPSEVVATYIGVLGILAITKESKLLFKRKQEIIKEHDEKYSHHDSHDHR